VYSASTTSGVVSIVVQPIARVAAARPTGRCSAALTPRCAALIRSAASFDTIVVGEIRAWPSAAPMIRLSGSDGSRPCSTRRCFCTPLISICTVPEASWSPIGTGSASDPPARTRNSSIVRSAVLAARPTSSGRPFSPSSSSITVIGMTTSTSPKPAKHPGSPISTEVSSTSRARTSVRANEGRTRASVKTTPSSRGSVKR
jgi:hypothetical protein